MELALVLTIVFFILAIAGIVLVNRDRVKLLETHIKILQEHSDNLYKQIKELLDKETERIVEKSKEVEHELQGEFEADDESYNRIVKEWIYGADEEEGGLNGE